MSTPPAIRSPLRQPPPPPPCPAAPPPPQTATYTETAADWQRLLCATPGNASTLQSISVPTPTGGFTYFQVGGGWVGGLDGCCRLPRLIPVPLAGGLPPPQALPARLVVHAHAVP